MNKTRRENLQKAIDLLSQAKDIIDYVADEESEARDNLPENLAGSERYEQMDENCDELESAADDLDGVIDQVANVI